jgi:glycosyltransferase involved in cell wall biosynthesis
VETLSIVTPSFNQGQFIRDCIESVLRQDDGSMRIEHIIIDACSTDNTFSIVKEYPHLIWISEPDRGQCDALNKGFKRASGGIVGWLNADDYYLPGAFSAVKTMANQPWDVLFGDCIFVNAKGNLIRKKVELPFWEPLFLYFGIYIPTTSSFFRKRIFEQGHYLDISYKYTMDYEYYIRLSRAGAKFRYLRKFLACQRFHAANISSDLEGRRRDRLKTLDNYGVNFLPGIIPKRFVHSALNCIFKTVHIFLKAVTGAYFREGIVPLKYRFAARGDIFTNPD